MMKKYKHALLWTLMAVAYAVLLQLNDPCTFQFMEQRHTFFADGGYMRYTLSHLGGISILISDMLTQFFSIPFMGIVVSALLLTLATWMTYRVLRRLTDIPWLAVLCMIPNLAFAAQMSDMNFQYFGFVSYIIMLAVLLGFMNINGTWKRLAYAAVGTIVLFATCGAIAMLFAAAVVVIEIFRAPKTAAFFLAAPLLAYVSGVVAYHAGLASSMKNVLTPHAYFTLRLEIGNRVWLTWAWWMGVVAVGCLSGLLKYSKKWFRGLTATVISLVAAGACLFFVTFYTSRVDCIFKEISTDAYKGDWDGIIKKCKSTKLDNFLFQNYLNVALAEKGKLAEFLFEENVQSIRSIYVESNNTPYVSAMLSDVFFSMGHLGLAQRYAFEGLEGWGSYSPRMYERLAVTNMAYGKYGVAEKYLTLLSKNMMHRKWAKRHLQMLGDESAIMSDPTVSDARKCIFPENKLSGLNGLDEDLMRVIEANPGHKQTVQYLGCLYLLLKDGDSFMSMIGKYVESGAVSTPLPTLFQEAVISFAGTDAETCSKYGIGEDMLKRYDAFQKKPSDFKKSFWFYLNYL